MGCHHMERRTVQRGQRESFFSLLPRSGRIKFLELSRIERRHKPFMFRLSGIRAGERRVRSRRANVCIGRLDLERRAL